MGVTSSPRIEVINNEITGLGYGWGSKYSYGKKIAQNLVRPKPVVLVYLIQRQQLSPRLTVGISLMPSA